MSARTREQRLAGRINQLSYLRVGLVLVVMALLLGADRVSHAYAAAAVLFLVAAATDFLDGFLARRLQVTTTLGAFLDTTADKLLVTGALIALVAVGRASAWAALIIVGRELAILGLRAVAAAGGTIVTASLWGKLKANVQFVAIALAIIRFPLRLGWWYLDEWVMLVAVIVTLLSAVEYFRRLAPVLGRG